MSCGAPGEVRAGGLRLRTHAWPRPGRRRALLLHSLAAHGHWWDWAAPRLAEHLDVVALDLRGHGGSDHADGYGFADHAADVVAALDALGGAAPLVIGHSLGAYVGAWVAAHHPGRVAGLVIADMLTAWPAELAELARRQAARPPASFPDRSAAGERFRLSPPEPARVPERLRHLGEAGVVEHAPGVWAHAFDRRVFLHPPVDPWAFLPRVDCPALVVHGEHSAVMDAAACRAVAAAVPRGQAATLTGAHHHLVVTDPDGFCRLVLDWHRAMIGA